MVYLETAWNAVRAARSKAGGVTIIDLAGGGLGMLGYVSSIKQIARTAALMYPEINALVVIVNAGWFAAALWATLKPFLPARTEKKIKLLNADYVDAIAPEVTGGVESLPDFLGGRMLAKDQSIDPAMTVDEAYGSITNEICSGAVTYPDSDEFLSAALLHAKRLSPSSEHHRDRVSVIETFLKNKHIEFT